MTRGGEREEMRVLRGCYGGEEEEEVRERKEEDKEGRRRGRKRGDKKMGTGGEVRG